MNGRRSLMWWLFAMGAAAVLGALAWASVLVHHLEQRNESNRADARRQELIRLALWRLDSQMAPILATEAARPLGEQSWHDGAVADRRESTPPSPGTLNAFADGYFVVEGAEVQASDDRTKALAERLANEGALADQPQAEPQAGQVAESAESTRLYDYQARQQITNLAQRAVVKDEAAPVPQAAVAKRDAEAGPARENAGQELFSSLASGGGRPESAPVEARWVETGAEGVELVLVRTVRVGPEGERTDGVRLDWPGLRATLQDSVTDLLPGAVLMPAQGVAAAEMERRGSAFRLATIPALLVPGELAVGATGVMSPVLWALVITWVAAVGALVVVALVLRATLRLSDRRATFVGAVTHELRTPLTTFRLYAQMLAGGMVTDEKARTEYLGTLERESIRLAEIVENVLEYARLTRRRPGGGRPPGERPISPSELLARVRPVLSRRAEQSGMDLIVSVDPAVERSPTVTCDPRSVERVLMNLVENACKYAVPEGVGEGGPDDADTRIHLDIGRSDRALEVLVADHGPGIPRRDRERVFGEFQRGPGAAGGSRPGLGLGLALSRGLAREMGGDLRLVRRRAHGAEFLLTIPFDEPVPAPGGG